MRTYPEYKDSGVEWIGDIPKHWSTSKIKYIHKQNENSFIDGDWIESPHIDDDGIRYITTGNIGEGRFKYQGNGHISEDTFQELNCTEVFPGDLIISRLSPPVGRSCIIPDLGKRIVTSVDNVIIRLQDDFLKNYYNYIFNSKNSYENTSTLSRGTTLTRISRSILGDIKTLVPPLSEQKQISDYLDRKTQQIDDLIEKTERKIDLLKEQRSSLINQCVTKGLDPNVEMKDSGVEWIGEIPKGWNLKKLTRVCTKIRNGYVGPTRDIMKEDGVKYIQGIHIKSGEIKYTPDGPYYVSPEWSDQHNETLLEEGDVLVVQTGTIGEVGYVTREFENSNCHALIIVRINKNIGNGRFLLYSFLGSYIQNYLQSIKTGEILYHINTKKLRFLNVLTPPLPEQKQISDYLDQETSKIDQMVDTETKRIDLLKEYRQSLISNVVTGKIDVRDEVVQ